MHQRFAVTFLLAAVIFFVGTIRTDAGSAQVVIPEWFLELDIGLPTADLLHRRPNARAASFGMSDPRVAVDLNQLDQVLSEQLVFRIEEEYTELVSYFIRGGKLRGCIFVSKAPLSKHRSKRPIFLQQCLEKYGLDYARLTTKLKDGRIEYVAPLLGWTRGHESVRVFCTPDMENITIPAIWLGVIRYEEGFESLFTSTIPEHPIKDVLRDDVFRSVGLEAPAPTP